MYTATMLYHFVPERFDEACALWERHVLAHVHQQAGFVRMQLLVAPPRALAIGTWEHRSSAEAFMETGVFKNLMLELEPLCTATPQPTVWDLRYFDES